VSEPDAAQVKQAAMELLQLTDTLVQELLTEDHPGPIVTSIAIYLGKLSDSIKELISRPQIDMRPPPFASAALH
jgi:hypothetical protein